jgi:2-isopropylmalate synthase
VTGARARLERYEIRAVTSGTEAMGEVTVKLEENGQKVVGRGASTDVIEASAKAYIDCLNQLARKSTLRTTT